MGSFDHFDCQNIREFHQNVSKKSNTRGSTRGGGEGMGGLELTAKKYILNRGSNLAIDYRLSQCFGPPSGL